MAKAESEDINREARVLIGRIKALESALWGCCWACAKAGPAAINPSSFPRLVICENRKTPRGGKLKCANWEFAEKRFTE
jgi:hypothetical protein